MENIKIIEEKENPLFKRKEIKFEIDAEVTPSYLEVGKFISEKFNSPLENIKIKNVLGKFGSKTFTISATLYDSKEDKEKIERRSKKDFSEKPVEAPAEQPAEASEEKPQEEQKIDEPAKEEKSGEESKPEGKSE